MTICRALPVVALIVAIPFAAAAQFGGIPGCPDCRFGGPPAVRPPPVVRAPACQPLSTLRDETLKHSKAMQEAYGRNATVQELCPLLRTFLSALSAQEEFMKGIEESGVDCGSRPTALKELRDLHSHFLPIGKRTCEAAACPLCGKTGDFWTRDEHRRLFGR